MVSSSIIHRVVAGLGRRLEEVPIGFRWFVAGRLDGALAFGGEESASFLRRDARPWSTDEDGLIMCLLAAEMTARTGKDPGRLYAEVTGQLDPASTPSCLQSRAGGQAEPATATMAAGDVVHRDAEPAVGGTPLLFAGSPGARAPRGSGGLSLTAP